MSEIIYHGIAKSNEYIHETLIFEVDLDETDLVHKAIVLDMQLLGHQTID